MKYVKNCPTCGGDVFEVVEELKMKSDQRHNVRVNVRVQECRQCGEKSPTPAERGSELGVRYAEVVL